MTGTDLETPALAHGDMHDGLTARRHAVDLRWDGEGLSLAGDDLAERVGWDVLTTIDSLPEAIVLGRTDRPGWRLRLGHDAPADLLARLPRRPRFGRWIDRFGLGKSLVCFAAISSLLGFVAVNAPTWLGRQLPVSWETGMSDDEIEDLSANTCQTKSSAAALAALVSKLDRENADGHLPPVKVELIKLDYVNAVALPGGRVLVFDGLLKQIDSPDALAGVIGHEIGHVRERHVMQAMLREFGISMVLSGLRSGMTNTLGSMMSLRYSREAESEADEWSRKRLAESGISPLPIARFFTDSEDQGGEAQFAMSAYLNSHPDSGTRANAFRAAYRSDAKYSPALDGGQFDAIRYACEDDTKAKTWQPQVL